MTDKKVKGWDSYLHELGIDGVIDGMDINQTVIGSIFYIPLKLINRNSKEPYLSCSPDSNDATVIRRQYFNDLEWTDEFKIVAKQNGIARYSLISYGKGLMFAAKHLKTGKLMFLDYAEVPLLWFKIDTLRNNSPSR